MLHLSVFAGSLRPQMTSSKLANALDLSKEDPKIVERYGTGDPTKFMDGNGAPRVPQSLLAARRLIEAGARVVTQGAYDVRLAELAPEDAAAGHGHPH